MSARVYSFEKGALQAQPKGGSKVVAKRLQRSGGEERGIAATLGITDMKESEMSDKVTVEIDAKGMVIVDGEKIGQAMQKRNSAGIFVSRDGVEVFSLTLREEKGTIRIKDEESDQ